MKREQNYDISCWLKDFEIAVREREPAIARRLFDDGIFGFGTIAESYIGLSDYEERQWNFCWNASKDFQFDLTKLIINEIVLGEVFVVGVHWRSVGVRTNGDHFLRSGRATLVLKRSRISGELVAIHSHFSKTPLDFPQEF